LLDVRIASRSDPQARVWQVPWLWRVGRPRAPILRSSVAA
jgi:hypothetical protein